MEKADGRKVSGNGNSKNPAHCPERGRTKVAYAHGLSDCKIRGRERTLNAGGTEQKDAQWTSTQT